MFTHSFRPPPRAGVSSGGMGSPWKPMARAVYMHSPALPIDARKTLNAAETRPHEILGYDIPFIMALPQHQQFATISSAEGIGTSERPPLPQSHQQPQGSLSARGPRSSLPGIPRVSLVVDPYQALTTEGMLTSRTSIFASTPATPVLARSLPISTAQSHQAPFPSPSGFDYRVALPTPRAVSAAFKPSSSSA
ncbi:hypothetical protein FOZ60_009158 [Perkinsus olseni]|uniref:Uncharacterized protein n=1 Tax=Perkinsus olseni TaxID=32597 RepID=A0A7J6PCY8_PEROL|nr:hypothetical protein FOZ60_009158 [Perkinsus olseni]